jgi:hypothetical protein
VKIGISNHSRHIKKIYSNKAERTTAAAIKNILRILESMPED